MTDDKYELNELPLKMGKTNYELNTVMVILMTNILSVWHFPLLKHLMSIYKV